VATRTGGAGRRQTDELAVTRAYNPVDEEVPDMIRRQNLNPECELGGINHVALVCADTARTVDFYSGILGTPLIKSLDLRNGRGQHFFSAADTSATSKTSATRELRHPVAN
jgi:hypothetical protein